MRYIDGKVQADNVNKIVLELDYRFFLRVFQGKDCISILHKEGDSRTAFSVNFFSSKIGYTNLSCRSHFWIRRW